MTKCVLRSGAKNQLSVADRIKLARTIAGFSSRKDFAERFSIPLVTLASWERGINALNEKGAQRLIACLKEKGIICTSHWLLQGDGPLPQPESVYFESVNPSIQHQKDPSTPSLLKEVAFFLRENKNGKIFWVNDKSMTPFYQRGDYVGGLIVEENQWSSVFNRDCIVITDTDQTLLRRVVRGPDQKGFGILCLNPGASQSAHTSCCVRLICIAPVIWIRRSLDLIST